MLPGSIPDVSSLKTTISILKELGITDYVSSLDRGFYSASNIRNMLENDIGFVLGASQSSAQRIQLIQKHQGTIRSPKYSIKHNGNIVRHTIDKWIVDMGNSQTKELDAHIIGIIIGIVHRKRIWKEKYFNYVPNHGRICPMDF
jgi:transposase